MQDKEALDKWINDNPTESRPNRAQVIVVGLIDHVTTCYVVVRDYKYEFVDLVSAVDCCLKIHLVFSIKFTDLSSHIWSFFAGYIYEISGIKYLSKVSKLIASLEELRAKRDQNVALGLVP